MIVLFLFVTIQRIDAAERSNFNPFVKKVEKVEAATGEGRYGIYSREWEEVQGKKRCVCFAFSLTSLA